MKRGRQLNHQPAGFTIIESLLVLAMAGFILLIVFEAIPALTRSSRNNQRKQDVQFILRTVSEYELKDSGNFPESCGSGQYGVSSSFAIAGFNCDQPDGSPTQPNDAFLHGLMNKVTFYQASDIGLYGQTSNAGNTNSRIDQPGPNNADKVEVFNYEKCDPSNVGKAIIAGAGYNDVVALYDLETGSGPPTPQCQQL